ncbi:hypothetical protein NUU61_006678 [Penicillium alfredii]|uniref:Aminoglycoside phosphotransferase domain-containing protein n=1 Tax=Penicillium alfredii TaxID=1506179 RepID=A0A9W9F190_9EURO|nr:uncharacterized protein NUU61_006678 [Penicillium alfredii]KAJ5091808.1 hypothetical protein NUU61_006678 [Penicillium alfredii]
MTRWRVSRNEATDANFSKDDPDPTPQQLKLIAEFVITSYKTFPSQQTAFHKFTSFISKWERKTSRSLPEEIKHHVLNVKPGGFFWWMDADVSIVVFSHADLHPSNILIDRGRRSGIVD